jgi:flagellar FliL protein
MSAAPTDNAAASDQGTKPKGKGRLLIIIGAVVVLAAGGGGVWFWKSRQAPPAEEAAKHEPLAPLQFYPMNPPFVVNFPAKAGVRFLQLEVRIGSRDSETVALLKATDPVIRNDLLMLYGAQDAAALASREGKEKLRTDTLDAVRKVVKAEGGKPEAVEAVFFTSFVMQ